ncbi:GNAT family N-acetyltransferase [Candidatus Thiothrix sp. Deng01]|uniref:GNAT family N-acetyltransferase n=1 Tax=Candidatus Thiothrix phosphatis TaxID=3112415 RepID=A0ABU6CXG3_9GAMM|nr:GNAT family N-acetyltransferase [Candidatus Thiothrix sp. Deng01]MEB4591521.1 GNAT family N-acetyltransferase [Candidatus Thiothrix sp. Deng01]
MPDSLLVQVRRLESHDDRSSFCSGDIELDRFFQRFAGQNQFRHYVGTSYIADCSGQIAGFATVSSGEITAEILAGIVRKRLPDYPLPILRLARLAVDQRFQGQGIGKLLLKAMLELALQLRDQTGCIGVLVDAKPTAVDFYTKLGFQALESVSGELGNRPEPLPMFLPIQTIAKALV